MCKLFCSVVCLLALSAPASAVVTSVRVPLHEGRLRTSDLSHDLLARLRVPRCDWLETEIDLTGLGGSRFVAAWNRSLGEGCEIAIHDDALVVRIDTEKLPDDVDEAKLAARVFTETAAPKAAADQKRFYGLLLPQEVDESRAMTILVHGLDCNRGNWAPMAEYLIARGHQVAYFTYPSDQPLVDSAATLREEVARLREVFPNLAINVLTHSMGALVAREFIEGPGYTGGVERLILIAPPNHGSKWASLRWALEIEEHYYLWRDEPTWHPTWAITDGLGEAGRDLKSRSRFLAQLNERPRREGVRYTIVAGNRHTAARIAGDALDGTARIIPRSTRDWWGFRHTYRGLRHAADDVREAKAKSDGPVTVKSTRLEGVEDFVLVHADHDSIYLPLDGKTEPPAWAVVDDRLRR